jgi:hypothetical protein
MVDFRKRLEEERMARDPDRKKKSRREDEEDAKPVDVEAELKELESAWDEAEDKGDSFGDIPDDVYQAKVSKATIGKSQSSGRMQVAFEFTIISGEFKNRKKWAYDGLETKENMDYLKTRLARLGVDVKKLKISDLPEALESILGTTCEIKVKTRGDFQNTYVQKQIDVDDVEDGGDSDDEKDWKPSKRSRDEDEDDEPKKKSKRDEDESDDADDDEPKKKSRDEDEADEDDEPKKKSRRDEDEDEDDDKPKKKSKDEDEDDDADDEKPAKKSKDEDEDEDDDEPKKKAKDEDEDDEDEKPRKKKSRF